MVGGGVAMLGGRWQCRAELVFIFFSFFPHLLIVQLAMLTKSCARG